MMNKAVLISVNKPHTDNIHSYKKKSELRTKPPKISCPFKVFMYETLKNGGCGKVVSEWICKNMTEWLMYMGLPAHLSKVACISNEEILAYCNNGKKNITEMKISDLVVYEKPRELNEFFKYGFDEDVPLNQPPQSWCYVKE